MYKVVLPSHIWKACCKIAYYQDGAGHYAFYSWELKTEIRQLIESMGGRIEYPLKAYEPHILSEGFAVFRDLATAVTFKLQHL